MCGSVVGRREDERQIDGGSRVSSVGRDGSVLTELLAETPVARQDTRQWMWCDGNIHNRRWLRALRRRGVQVRPFGWTSMRIDDEPEFLAVSDRVWLDRVPKVRRFQLARRLRRIADGSDADLILVQFPSSDLVGLAGSRVPLAVHLWGSDVDQIYHRATSGARAAFRRIIRSARIVTAYSQRLLAAVREFSNPDAITGVVELTPESAFHPAGDRRDARKYLGLPHDAMVILSARGIGAVYRTVEIIQAACEFLRRYPAALLVQPLYGPPEPEYREKCHWLAQSLGIGRQVAFIPPLDYVQMPSAYQAADVVVNFARSDGGPATLREAMACGACIVSSGLETYRGLLKHEENALVVGGDEKEVERLSRAILLAGESESLRRQLAEGALHTAAGFVNFDSQFDWVVQQYRAIVASSRGASGA